MPHIKTSFSSRREFLEQSWFVARVSLAPTLLVAIPFTVLISFTLNILLRELGVEASEISQVLLAGSFGAYLTPLSAVRIGLVPRMALPRIMSAGNVAGEGAKIAALSLRERAEAESILREVEYVELSGRADFNDLFIDQLAFPG